MRVCRLCVVPQRWCDRWQWLVVAVSLSLVQVIVRCGPVCRVGGLACGGPLRWGVVVMQLVGIAVVLGHQGVGVRGREGVLMVLLATPSLALREWWFLCGVDLCGQWSAVRLPG